MTYEELVAQAKELSLSQRKALHMCFVVRRIICEFQ